MNAPIIWVDASCYAWRAKVNYLWNDTRPSWRANSQSSSTVSIAWIHMPLGMGIQTQLAHTKPLTATFSNISTNQTWPYCNHVLLQNCCAISTDSITCCFPELMQPLCGMLPVWWIALATQWILLWLWVMFYHCIGSCTFMYHVITKWIT